MVNLHVVFSFSLTTLLKFYIDARSLLGGKGRVGYREKWYHAAVNRQHEPTDSTSSSDTDPSRVVTFHSTRLYTHDISEDKRQWHSRRGVIQGATNWTAPASASNPIYQQQVSKVSLESGSHSKGYAEC
jgi:hypothetical protein